MGMQTALVDFCHSDGSYSSLSNTPQPDGERKKERAHAYERIQIDTYLRYISRYVTSVGSYLKGAS